MRIIIVVLAVIVFLNIFGGTVDWFLAHAGVPGAVVLALFVLAVSALVAAIWKQLSRRRLGAFSLKLQRPSRAPQPQERGRYSRPYYAPSVRPARPVPPPPDPLDGEEVALDDMLLTSERLRLKGRPDRLFRANGLIIPEEWKSAEQPHRHHCLQLAAYMLLVEDKFGIRPPYGVLVAEDEFRFRVANTEELRNEALAVANEIRVWRAGNAHPLCP